MFYPNRRATEKKVAQILSVSLSRFLSVDNDKKSEARLLFRTDVSCASSLNLLGEEDKMSFRLFGLEWSSRWKTLSIYEKFEQLIVSILTWIIAVIVAVATWQLILHTVGMIRSHLLDPRDS